MKAGKGDYDFGQFTCFNGKVGEVKKLIQVALESSNENDHEYSLRNSTFNGSRLKSLTDIVTSQLTLIFKTEIWN